MSPLVDNWNQTLIRAALPLWRTRMKRLKHSIGQRVRVKLRGPAFARQDHEVSLLHWEPKRLSRSSGRYLCLDHCLYDALRSFEEGQMVSQAGFE